MSRKKGKTGNMKKRLYDEVDPYEDMDVEGLMNLEDYVAPQKEKQIA